MKKFIFPVLSGTILVSFWLLSCTKNHNTDPCGPFDNRFISTGVSLYTLRVISYDSVYHAYLFDTLHETDTVPFNKLAIQVIPVKKFYMGSAHQKRSTFSIFNEVYACTPPIPYSVEENYVTITCTKDFDQIHKSGNNLVDIFDVAILDLYKNIIYYRMSLKDYLALRPNSKDELILLLNKAPEKADNYTFTIEYYRTFGTDEKVFEVESGNIFLLKE